MKAITLSCYGDIDCLELSDVPAPTPKADELLIRNYATALNRADIMQRKGKYPPPAGASPILGMEIAGEVVGWGDNVTGFSRGQRVFGLVSGGGYAEYCCIDKEMAMAIPDHWDYTTAAAVPEVFMTANETIFELGGLQKGEAILIHAGASGVGTAAVQMTKYRGAIVYFTAGSDDKISKVLALGADAGINYNTQDFTHEISRLTNSQGVDVVEDFLGGNYFQNNLLCLKEKGRLIVVAYMGGAKAEIDLSLVLRKRLQIKGSVMRTRSLADKRAITARFMHNWLPILSSGAIKPVIDSVYAIEDVRLAHQRMEQKSNFGKIILTIFNHA